MKKLKIKFLKTFFDQPEGDEFDLETIFTPKIVHKIIA